MKYQKIALLGDTHGMKEIVKTVLIIKYSNDAYVAPSCYLGVPSLISSRFYIKTPFSKKIRYRLRACTELPRHGDPAVFKYGYEIRK